MSTRTDRSGRQRRLARMPGLRMGSDGFDLMALVVISAVSLVSAIICFGFLHSTWSVNTTYSAAGAGGFFISAFIAIGRVYRQFRNDQFRQERRDREVREEQQRREKQVDELKSIIQQLQNKLVRGASSPAEFAVEVDEYHHIVLARPRDWVERGGIIWEYQEPLSKTHSDDRFPATFKVSWWPMPKGVSAREYYQQFRAEIFEATDAKPYVGHHTAEVVVVGGHQEGHKSLKVISKHWAEVDIDPAKCTVDYKFITKDTFDQQHCKSSADVRTGVPGLCQESTHVDEEAQVKGAARSMMGLAEKTTVYAELLRSMVISCNERLRTVFIFEALDDRDDFADMTETFNQIFDSVRFLVPSSVGQNGRVPGPLGAPEVVRSRQDPPADVPPRLGGNGGDVGRQRIGPPSVR